MTRSNETLIDMGCMFLALTTSLTIIIGVSLWLVR